MSHLRVQVSPLGAARIPGLGGGGGRWSLRWTGTPVPTRRWAAPPKDWRLLAPPLSMPSFAAWAPEELQDLGLIRSLSEVARKTGKPKTCASNWHKTRREFEMDEAGREGERTKGGWGWVTSPVVTSHATHLLNTVGTPFCSLMPCLRNRLVEYRKVFKGETSPLCSWFSDPANSGISWYTYPSVQISPGDLRNHMTSHARGWCFLSCFSSFSCFFHFPLT